MTVGREAVPLRFADMPSKPGHAVQAGSWDIRLLYPARAAEQAPVTKRTHLR
jgi:hypothetical protein